MYSKREQWIIFAIVNGVVVFGALLYPLYLLLVDTLPQMTCGALTFLGIYCPACGGTRALGALLRFDLVSAVKYNLLVPLGAVLFLVYDTATLLHLARGGAPRESFVRKPIVLTVTAVLIVYTILRNLLLLWGMDPLGNILG